MRAFAAIRESQYSGHPSSRPARTAPSPRSGARTRSDWHVGEVVDKRKVRGLNSYSPEIARKRASSAGVHDEAWRYPFELQRDSMVLFLGGDFISGYLHEELAQTNAMAPVEETRYAGASDRRT